MTPLAWAAAHPFLSSALILAAGFTAGVSRGRPRVLPPAPCSRPARVLPSAVPSHGHPASPSPRRHRHHRASLDPRAAVPVHPSWRRCRRPVAVLESVAAPVLADGPGAGVLEHRADAEPEPEHACPVARGVGLAYRK